MKMGVYEHHCLETAGGLLQLFHHNKRLFQSTIYGG